MQYQNLIIEKLHHATVKVKGGGKVIYFDPYKLQIGDIEPADFIFSSHEHFDHCSPEDISKLIKSETVLITIPLCKEKLGDLISKFKEIKYVKPGDVLSINGINIEAVPAYNIDKFRSPGVPYHPPTDGKVGFVLEIDGVRVYHAGDTDYIPEMKSLKNIDVAFLPVSGTYVMTAEEAAEAAKAINPKLAVPMHYSEIVGTIDDAKKFKELAGVPVSFI